MKKRRFEDSIISARPGIRMSPSQAQVSRTWSPFGLYLPGTGVGDFEAAKEWTEISGGASPLLTVPSDSFVVLAEFNDMLDALAAIDENAMTPHAFSTLLREHRFEDFTARSRPERRKAEGNQ
ncbi:hypothetical protein ACI2UK_24425 [Ralstonia nicotianae]|uniref:hypothetical protein n=1 Tax=Ralstonia pseudosolanacearum TaxID=1310165 RepID=UPI002003B3A4|nr:hypothetical protein [Ralstonia pseudosolanacearum]MCK4120412.1 hypothetical protein [Ralstonia pseudosolanacearum]